MFRQVLLVIILMYRKYCISGKLQTVDMKEIDKLHDLTVPCAYHKTMVWSSKICPSAEFAMENAPVKGVNFINYK